MMDVKVSAVEFESFRLTNKLPEALQAFYVPGSTIMSVEASFGTVLLQLVELNGFRWLYYVFDITEDVTLLTTIVSQSLTARIVIQGSFGQSISGMGSQMLKSGQFIVFHHSFQRNKFSLKKGSRYILLDVLCTPEFMLQALKQFPKLDVIRSALSKGEPVLLSKGEEYCNAAILATVSQLTHTPYSPNVSKFHLFLIEDLLNKILAKMSETHPYSLRFTIEQTDQIKEAKKFIDKSLPHHFSISQISKKIGINEQKLKNGYKEIYGVGLFEYLREQVLQIAKTELEQTSKSIKEIALNAGYKNQNNFSAAFKKKFGSSPTNWRESTRS